MKCTPRLYTILLTAGLAMLPVNGRAQSVDNEIQVARKTLQADRRATVTEAMQFSEQEATAFWPLYEEYRAKRQTQGDAVLKLVKEYALLYPNIPDDRAKIMLKDLAKFEKERVEIRNSYLKKIGKVLSPAKTLRFAQVDSRLDLATQIELATHIPLVPVEGRLTGQGIGAAFVTEGVPGGNIVATYELTATVASMDKTARKLTLVDDRGIKTTVKVGLEALNFDQIRLGDRLTITAAEELVVYLAGEGEASSDGGAQLVALAPKGAKPGGLVVETTQVTATVAAIDLKQRKATLAFEDGSTRTVAVRADVDLNKRKVGDKVVIRTTESLLIRMVKP